MKQNNLDTRHKAQGSYVDCDPKGSACLIDMSSTNSLFIARLLLALAVPFFAVALISPPRNSAGAKVDSRSLQSPSPTPRPITNGGTPVVSPDGKHIAFNSDRGGAPDLFVINSDGTGERQLTNTPENEGNLQWSSDGKILFSVFKNDASRLYAIDSDGKNQRELVSVPGRAPTLSPDGKQMVYMAGTWTATRLMLAASDGSNARQINDGSSIAWNSHWSPDGKRIAFTGRDEPNGELAVFVMDAEGSGRKHLTHVPAEEGGAQWPVWSPNGRQLAVQVNSRAQKGSAHIWIVDVTTGDAHKLAAHAESYLDETPSWFPDGKRIAFQSNRTGRMEVWVMNTNGSGAKQVTDVK